MLQSGERERRLAADRAVWFYALDRDKSAFEQAAGRPLRAVACGAATAHEYRVGGHAVVAAKKGSGNARTAATVASVLAVRPARRMISTGPAGWLGEGDGKGRWFVVETVVGWQAGRWEGGSGPAGGGAEPLAWTPDDWPQGAWSTFARAALASGEAFVAGGEARAALRRGTGADLVDMNTSGILAGLGEGVKVLVMRVASDRADGSADADFGAFVRGYDGEGGRMVAELVRGLPPSEDEPGSYEGLRKLIEGDGGE